MITIIKTVYNIIIELIALVMKIGIILSLPVMFIYFLFNQKKI